MPLRDRQGYLWDIARATEHIRDFTDNKTLADYREDAMLRSAVERQLELVGEAMSQMLKHFPELENDISSARQIIAFRNRLIHAYAVIDDAVVWGVLEEDLGRLNDEIECLLEQ